MRVNPESVLKYNSEFDGHINRNIRLAIAMIDTAKPYIEIVKTKESEEKIEITWQVNGCFKLNEARIVINGTAGKSLITKDHDGRCNYLGKQTVFTSVVKKGDNFELQAVADQEFGEALNRNKVSPREMAGKPQLHLTRLRTEDKYEVRQPNGRILKGGRVISLSQTQCKHTTHILYHVDKNYNSQTDEEAIEQTAVKQKESLSCKLISVENYRKFHPHSYNTIFRGNGRLHADEAV